MTLSDPDASSQDIGDYPMIQPHPVIVFLKTRPTSYNLADRTLDPIPLTSMRLGEYCPVRHGVIDLSLRLDI